jgi:hypothetical protein
MKNIIILIFLISFSIPVFSQTEEQVIETIQEEPVARKPRPVRGTFDSGALINSQAALIPTHNSLEYMIQHRFGKISGETFDLLGLYAPANIRMGINYSILPYMQIGIGTTKNQKLQDGNVKIRLLQQKNVITSPVSVVYYGNAALSAREPEFFQQFSHRMSYFHQLIIARKISTNFSLQLAPSFSHFNVVDSLMNHDIIAVSFNGRYKISPQTSILFEYDHQLTKHEPEFGKFEVKPNIGAGIEISTGSHSFQIFISSFDAIVNQRNMAYNTNDFTEIGKGLLLGFNINRLWNF